MKFLMNVAGITVVAALLTVWAPQTSADPAETEKQMLAMLDAWITAWDTGNTDPLDAIAVPGIQRTAPDQNANGLDEYKALIAEIHTIYPDFRISNDGMAVGPGIGFIQWTVTGTDSGSENATGNALKATGISRYHFEDGRIVSEFVVFDTGAVLTQLEREALPHGKR